jgi:hypothetical protein
MSMFDVELGWGGRAFVVAVFPSTSCSGVQRATNLPWTPPQSVVGLAGRVFPRG